MIKCYDVDLNGACVGKAEVTETGLYYQICCKCCFPTAGSYQIYVKNGERSFNLGTCVPTDDRFGMCTKVAKKHIGEGKFSFIARRKGDTVRDYFAPVDPHEPFLHLSVLRNARFAIKDGQPGVMIREIQSASDGE